MTRNDYEAPESGDEPRSRISPLWLAAGAVVLILLLAA